MHAQRLIVERGGEDLVVGLEFHASMPVSLVHAYHALHQLGQFDAEPGTAKFKRSGSGPFSFEGNLAGRTPEEKRITLALWPAEVPCPFDPVQEKEPFVIREWLLLAARMPADEATGRKLRDWHRNQQQLRRGEVLDRCYAMAAARHSTGFLLASLENAPDPSVLKERIYPAAIKAFAENRSPQVLAMIEKNDSPLGQALKEAIKEHKVEKKHNPPAELLARGEGVYARTCAACHQSNGSGVDGAFPPLDGNARVAGNPEALIKIVLHGLAGPVEVPGKLAVNSLMPPVVGLSDAEIAEVLSFVRHSWTNDAAAVSAEEAGKVRAATKERQAAWTVGELK